MRRARHVAAMVIVAATALVAARTVMLRLRENALEPVASGQMMAAWSSPDSYAAAPLARRTLEQLRPHLERDRRNVNVMMIAAASLRILHQYDAALSLYDRALALERRPELYLQRGLTQIEAGRRASAVPDLITANLFYPNSFNDIPDVDAYYAAQAIVTDREERIRSQLRATQQPFGLGSAANLLEHLQFENAGPSGARTAAGGIGAVGSSAAEPWNVWNGANGTTMTELLPSTRRPGRKMLHVRTTAATSGIWCFWLPAASGPPRVISSAWLQVNRGRVTIGSGNAGATVPDAASAPQTDWQRVEAANHVCPANATLIYSDEHGGADFFIDEVVVRPLPDTPCQTSVDPDVTRAAATFSSMSALTVALLVYRVDHGDFPPAADAAALRPALARYTADAEIVDAWGTPMKYERTPIGFRLISAGADRKFGAAAAATVYAADAVIDNGQWQSTWPLSGAH
jgi:hypothetical protein